MVQVLVWEHKLELSLVLERWLELSMVWERWWSGQMMLSREHWFEPLYHCRHRGRAGSKQCNRIAHRVQKRFGCSRVSWATHDTGMLPSAKGECWRQLSSYSLDSPPCRWERQLHCSQLGNLQHLLGLSSWEQQSHYNLHHTSILNGHHRCRWD